MTAPSQIEVVDRMMCCVRYSHFSNSTILATLVSSCSPIAFVLSSDRTGVLLTIAYGFGAVAVLLTYIQSPFDPIALQTHGYDSLKGIILMVKC